MTEPTKSAPSAAAALLDRRAVIAGLFGVFELIVAVLVGQARARRTWPRQAASL